MRRKCMDRLVQWKKDPTRKPLVVKGIRQCGKTWLLREFGGKNYDTCVYINLETEKRAAGFLEGEREAEEILLFLETYAGKPIRKDTTLLILDNFHCIFSGAQVLSSIGLDFPGYHIAAIERGAPGETRHDAGDVDFCSLFPLDFEEFLWADKEFSLAKEIRAHFDSLSPMGKALHAKASSKLRLYLAIGGMPASVLEYRREKKLLMVPDVQSQICSLMLADIAGGNMAGRARHCFLSVPVQICRGEGKFQYKQVASGGTAKFYYEALNWLVQLGLILPSPRKIGMMPQAQEDGYRYYFPDTGLFACSLGIPPYLTLAGGRFPQDKGLIEMYLAQAFLQNGYSLSSWSSGNQAYVPFLLEKESQYKAIDFRMDESEKMRNLSRYKDCGGMGKMYLLSPGDFQEKSFYRAIPFYGAFCI